jgi:hypothetical protein
MELRVNPLATIYSGKRLELPPSGRSPTHRVPERASIESYATASARNSSSISKDDVRSSFSPDTLKTWLESGELHDAPPPLILVARGDPEQVVFREIALLRGGGVATLELASHPGISVCKEQLLPSMPPPQSRPLNPHRLEAHAAVQTVAHRAFEVPPLPCPHAPCRPPNPNPRRGGM